MKEKKLDAFVVTQRLTNWEEYPNSDIRVLHKMVDDLYSSIGTEFGLESLDVSADSYHSQTGPSGKPFVNNKPLTIITFHTSEPVGLTRKIFHMFLEWGTYSGEERIIINPFTYNCESLPGLYVPDSKDPSILRQNVSSVLIKASVEWIPNQNFSDWFLEHPRTTIDRFYWSF